MLNQNKSLLQLTDIMIVIKYYFWGRPTFHNVIYMFQRFHTVFIFSHESIQLTLKASGVRGQSILPVGLYRG